MSRLHGLTITLDTECLSLLVLDRDPSRQGRLEPCRPPSTIRFPPHAQTFRWKFDYIPIEKPYKRQRLCIRKREGHPILEVITEPNKRRFVSIENPRVSRLSRREAESFELRWESVRHGGEVVWVELDNQLDEIGHFVEDGCDDLVV